MARTRVNVYAGGEWADPVLWYAKGVAAMQARPLADPTSWRFWAAMHGFDPPMWTALGHLQSSDQQPKPAAVRRFWKQCQHGSWYFLPWHRGYLLAFEAMVRAAIVDLGGPAHWSLPYWSPFGTGQAKLPPAFRSHTWPGTGPNPLFVSQRYGPHNDGNVFVPVSQVNLKALQRPHFTGVSIGGSPGFGGVDTGFSHGGQVHGELETQPHDWVHGLVGGFDPAHPTLPGLMSDPDTAALDPIFWLHHANIDRLWEIWNQADPGHTDPTGSHWTQGPASVGERAFVVPTPDGKTWTYVPHDVVSLQALGYEYDNLTPTGTGPTRKAAATKGAVPVPSDNEPELVGATPAALSLAADGASGEVHLDQEVRRSVTAGLMAGDQAPTGQTGGSDEIFLNLENVTGQSDATAFQVYVGLGPDEDPAAHPELLAGSIAPFGVRKASQPDGEHVGQGLTFVLDITDVVQSLHLDSSFDVDQLPVRLVPVHPVPAGAELSVGRISIYRHRT
jgi:tyrosinase